MFVDIRERERERKKHGSRASHMWPDWGLNPQPKYVPWFYWEQNPQPFGVWDDAPANWTTQPGLIVYLTAPKEKPI